MMLRMMGVLIGVCAATLIAILYWAIMHTQGTDEPSKATSATVPSTVVSTVAPPPPSWPEFDFAKRDRQVAWCLAHHGVPTMTFDRDGSNVLCLKPEAVIALPGE